MFFTCQTLLTEGCRLVFFFMYVLPRSVNAPSAYIQTQMLKTSAKGFWTNWEKPCWANGHKCFNSIPKEYQVALKYKLHFPVKEKNILADFEGIGQYFWQSEDFIRPHQALIFCLFLSSFQFKSYFSMERQTWGKSLQETRNMSLLWIYPLGT